MGMGVGRLIKELKERLGELEEIEDKEARDIRRLNIIREYKKKFTAYDYVSLARDDMRPKSIDFIKNIITDPIFLKGDRYFGDDRAILGGIGYLGDMPVTFISTNKGKTTEENIRSNFGMPNPEGYRKSLRLMKQAEKFNRPIISFIDTPGAYPGVEAEERGQSQAIARNIMEMGSLEVPVIAVFTGEGGSGGALALAIANRIIMMEFSIFSILSPEGFATILWKDSSRYREASQSMKLSSKDLLELGIIDRVIEEDISFSLEDYVGNFNRLRTALIEELSELVGKNNKRLVRERQEKFRQVGGGY